MRRLLTIALLLFASAALAEPVEQARAAHGRAEAAVRDAATRQARVRAEHETVVRQISARKAAAPARLPGVGDGTLDALLKQAHDLASALEAADRAIAAARREVDGRRQALLQAIDAQLGITNQRLANGSDAERRAAFAQMQGLASERARLMAAGQAARPETVRLPAVAEGASADELRELADEASDNVERVRAQLSALEARLSALNARKLMLRAANAFDTDTSLFAEDERNRQLARAERPAVAEAGAVNTPTADGRTRDGDAAEPGALAGANDDGVGQEAAPPQAEAPDRNMENSGGGFADPDTDGDGIFDAAPPPAAPSDVVVPTISGGHAAGGAVVFETALDPALLSDDVDALSPSAVAEQLRALRKKQAALRKAAAELARRRAVLKERAEALEKE